MTYLTYSQIGNPQIGLDCWIHDSPHQVHHALRAAEWILLARTAGRHLTIVLTQPTGICRLLPLLGMVVRRHGHSTDEPCQCLRGCMAQREVRRVSQVPQTAVQQRRGRRRGEGTPGCGRELAVCTEALVIVWLLQLHMAHEQASGCSARAQLQQNALRSGIMMESHKRKQANVAYASKLSNVRCCMLGSPVLPLQHQARSASMHAKGTIAEDAEHKSL